MAGYFLYSLDWPKLEQFLNSPSDAVVNHLALAVSDLLDDADSAIEDDDPLASWPSDPADLAPIIRDRLRLDDWYADLSDVGKELWEDAFTGLSCSDSVNPFAFACESDGVYWNIVDETIKFHAQPVGRLTKLEVTHFGARPFRYWRKGKQKWDQWSPRHSMHTPTEVAALAEQFEAAKAAIIGSRHEETEEDYAELMPVLARLVEQNRVLFVSVDT